MPAGHTARNLVRSTLAAVLGILAVVGVVASTLGVWAHQVLFDDDSVATAVGRALDEPEVTSALATYLTDQVFAAVDVEGIAESLLPTALQRFVPSIVDGAHAQVEGQLEDVLADDATRSVVTGIVSRSHAALLRVLEGDGLVDGITVNDGEVTANMLPLIGRGLTALQDIGLFPDTEIPELTLAGDPATDIAALEAAFGRQLPDDFGQLVVYRGDKLASAGQSVARAQNAVALAKRGIAVILVVTVVAFVATIVVARRRRRTTIVLLLASTAALLVTRAIVKRVAAAAPAIALEPGGRSAIEAVVDSLTSGLLTAVAVGIVVGALASLAVHLAGRERGEQAADARAARRFVDAHRQGTATVAFGAAALLLALSGLGTAQTIVAVLLAAVGAWALVAPTPASGT